MLDATHAGAREALEARLADDQHKLEAAGILEPIYEQLEEWARSGRGARDPARGREGHAAARRPCSCASASSHAHASWLTPRRRSTPTRAASARIRPPRAPRRELEELCALLDDGWARLVTLFEEALGREDIDPVLAHELATKVARAYEERLDKSDKAVEFYRRALAVEPDDEGALDALERIFTRDEQFAELLDVLPPQGRHRHR